MSSSIYKTYYNYISGDKNTDLFGDNSNIDVSKNYKTFTTNLRASNNQRLSPSPRQSKSPRQIEEPKMYNIQRSCKSPGPFNRNVYELSKRYTYTSPIRSIYLQEPNENLRRFSPTCQFNRSSNFSSNRTELIGAYNSVDRRNNLNPYKRRQICSCSNKPIDECSSCYCEEHMRQRNLFNLLNDMIEKDSKLEVIKESLAFCPDANLTDLFGFFDVSERESISAIDLSDALKDLGLFLPVSDLKVVFKRFDKDLDARLK